MVFSAGICAITKGKRTQEWLSENVPYFNPREEQPPYCPDLNPADFRIFSFLLSKVLAINHQSFEALKVKLQKEWAKIPQRTVVAHVTLFLNGFK